MPTFQSIPVHPSVRCRLLGSEQQGDDACDNPVESLQQQHQQQQPARSGVSIPRSLLTRDLNDLVHTVSRGEIENEEQKNEISAQMETIRFQVACKMISKTRNGKRLASNQQENNSQQKKHKPLIPGGSMSVLHAWRSQCEVRRFDGNEPQVFSTGCSDLDDLITFPAEYFFAPNGDQGVTNPDFISGEVKGIPRGNVLKLSGTSGKTQFSLQLVSQALLQSSRQSTTGGQNRVRYCYSTAGHSGHSLAQRLFQLIEKNSGRGEKRMLKEAAKKIEFQSIATVSQLTCTIASLEQEWLEQASHNTSDGSGKGPVSMLVLDALPLMLAESEDATKIQSLERWLKRLARHFSVLIVIVTTTGGGGGSSSIYDNAMSSDIHLQLQQRTPTAVSVQLIRHPARPVTKNDCITYSPHRCNA